jgi:hypothetical protein
VVSEIAGTIKHIDRKGSNQEGRNHTIRSNRDSNNQSGQADKNLLRFHGDAAASAVEDATVNYQSPSIIATGANAGTVSLAATLVNLALAVICMKAPSLIEKAGLGKRGAIILEFMNFCTWIPLALAFLLGYKGITPVLIAFLWFVNIMPGMLLSIQRDNWITNIVPKETIGRYLGQRMAIKSAFYLGGFCFIGYLLDEFQGSNLMGFGFVCTIGVIVTFVDYLIFTFMHEAHDQVAQPRKLESGVGKFKLFEYISELKEKKLSTFVSFTSLFYVSVGLSSPLYAVYMLQDLNFTYLSYTVIIAVEFLARIVSVPFWGRMADKGGNIKVLGIVGRVIPLLPLLWLFSSNIIYLGLVQSVSGICWGAYDLCTQSYLYKVAPPQKKLRYIVYTRSLMMLSSAAGGLLGAYAVNTMFPVFGSKLLSVFLLSGVFRAAIVMYMMPKMVDLAMNYGKTSRPSDAVLALGRAKASKRGMFYRRQNIFTRGLVPLRGDEIAIDSEKAQSNRRKWITEAKEKPKKKEVKHRPVTAATRLGLFQQPDVVSVAAETMSRVLPQPAKTNRVQKTKNIVAQTDNKQISGSGHVLKQGSDHKALHPKPGSKPVASKGNTSHGLYYNSEGWSKYMRQSMKDIMMESRDRKPSKKVQMTISG